MNLHRFCSEPFDYRASYYFYVELFPNRDVIINNSNVLLVIIVATFFDLRSI